MTTISKTYANNNNGGREQIEREGDCYRIRSDIGSGWMGWMKVSREQAEAGMSYTNAPSDVVSAILG